MNTPGNADWMPDFEDPPKVGDAPRTDALEKEYRVGQQRFGGVVPNCALNLARELERELAAAKEQWRLSSVCRELRAELDRERALADRLAHWLELMVDLDADGLLADTGDAHSAGMALAAWKAARIDAHLDECVAKSAESWNPLPNDPEQFYPQDKP